MAMEQVLLGRLVLVGVTVINRTEQDGLCQRLERKGIRIFESYDQMMAALAGQVDLVMLPTGIHWHAGMTLAALVAGAHVLVEKPLAPTLAEADAIIEAQARSGRLVAVGFQDLYVAPAHDIKRRVLAGEIGPLRRITVLGQWPRNTTYYQRNGWAGRLRVDGAWVLDSPVGNAYAHFLMLALFWAGAGARTAGRIETVEAELYRAGSIESFDTCCLRARTVEGVEILFLGTHAGAQAHAPEIRLQGDAGEIVWVYESHYTLSRPGHVDESHRVPDQLETRLTVLEAVLDRLEGGTRFVVEPALAREHTRLMNALHEFFPVNAVPANQLEPLPVPDDGFRRIRDLDATVALAARRHALFSELGMAWAVSPGPARDVRAYERFGGCRSGGAA